MLGVVRASIDVAPDAAESHERSQLRCNAARLLCCSAPPSGVRADSASPAARSTPRNALMGVCASLPDRRASIPAGPSMSVSVQASKERCTTAMQLGTAQASMSVVCLRLYCPAATPPTILAMRALPIPGPVSPHSLRLDTLQTPASKQARCNALALVLAPGGAGVLAAKAHPLVPARPSRILACGLPTRMSATQPKILPAACCLCLDSCKVFTQNNDDSTTIEGYIRT